MAKLYDVCKSCGRLHFFDTPTELCEECRGGRQPWEYYEKNVRYHIAANLDGQAINIGKYVRQEDKDEDADA